MSNLQPLRVAIGSDQPIYRRGLASIVLSIKNAQLVGEAADEEEAIQLCELAEPGVILLDFKAPVEAGKNLAHIIQGRWPRIKVILLVGAQEESQIESLDGKAKVYLFSKDISEEEFSAALLHIGQERRASWEEAQEFIEEVVSSQGRRRIQGLRPKGPVRSVYLAQEPDSTQREEIVARELVTAGKIQADILPEKAPTLPGWDISAKLESARETSGDFYDFIPLPNGHWGLVVADVTDKGMGAAIFMALSSTLLRTYAARYPTLPALTIDAVNERILTDTRGSMFITAFLGILEPHTGRFRYVNAGHPPACLVSTQKGKKPIDRLSPTGMALGIMETAQWQQKICRFNTGDVLLLYTDGITEAQNPQGSFFGEHRLIEVLRSKRGNTAEEIQDAVLHAVHQFVGDTPRQDDIAVIVVRRLN